MAGQNEVKPIRNTLFCREDAIIKSFGNKTDRKNVVPGIGKNEIA